MKNLKLIVVSLVFALVSIACQDKKDEPQVIENTTIIEKEVEKAPQEEKEGTSLSIDKNGVEFSTKKTDIKIKDGSADLEVEK